MSADQSFAWDARYGGDQFLFGEEPNMFLAAQVNRLKRGARALAGAEGPSV